MVYVGSLPDSETEEPFYFYYSTEDQESGCGAKTEDRHTIAISEVAETVKTIDPKFLPASMPVLYSNNSGNDYSLMGMTFDEWVANYQSLKNFWPVLVLENSSQFRGEPCKAVILNVDQETIDVFPDTSTGKYLRVYPDGSTEWFQPPV